MDNLTERQTVQVKKILNYLWYAANHPNERISLIYVVSDGSVQRSQKDYFKNRYKKLSLLADKLLASYIVDDKGQRHYLTDLYMDLHNIDISLTAESEADQYHIAANLPLSECLFNLDNIKPTRRTIPKML